MLIIRWFFGLIQHILNFAIFSLIFFVLPLSFFDTPPGLEWLAIFMDKFLGGYVAFISSLQPFYQELAAKIGITFNITFFVQIIGVVVLKKTFKVLLNILEAMLIGLNKAQYTAKKEQDKKDIEKLAKKAQKEYEKFKKFCIVFSVDFQETGIMSLGSEAETSIETIRQELKNRAISLGAVENEQGFVFDSIEDLMSYVIYIAETAKKYSSNAKRLDYKIALDTSHGELELVKKLYNLAGANEIISSSIFHALYLSKTKRDNISASTKGEYYIKDATGGKSFELFSFKIKG